jgi:hypothetical protein
VTNPFATRFTRPGAIEFLYAEGESAHSLVSKLRDHGWWGQIIGPHGSGKSTLLAALEPALQVAGREVVRFTLNQGQRSLNLRLLPPLTAGRGEGSSSLLVLDGYEQLSWWSRWRVKSHVRRAGAGLLVTAHTDVGLPTIFRTEPSLDLARRIIATLLPPGDSTLTDADIVAAHAAHPDNLREALFELFDVYQARHPLSPGAHAGKSPRGRGG